MNETYDTAIVPTGDNHHIPLLTTWLRYLFLLHLISVLLSVVGLIPQLTGILGWLARLVSLGCIVVLFRLGAANPRYRKSAIFYAISLGGTVLGAVTGADAFSTLFSICALIAEYQEYHSHSELCADRDPALSGRWTSLFWWQFGIGFLTSFLMVAGVLIGILAEMDTDILTTVVLIPVSLVGIVLELVFLNFLKKTIALYQK